MFEMYYGEDYSELEVSRHPKRWKRERTPYGYTFTDEEVQIDMRWTARSDGQVQWAVTVWGPDGGYTNRNGLDPYDEHFPALLRNKLLDIIKEEGWYERYYIEWTLTGPDADQ